MVEPECVPGIVHTVGDALPRLREGRVPWISISWFCVAVWPLMPS